MAVVLTVMKLVVRRLLILRLLTALPWCLPMTSPDPSLTFTGENSGHAELQEVPVDGTLSVSLSFRTAAREGLLLYMRETSTGHHVSLSISDGALSLQVYPDTNIVLVTEDNVKFNDNQWHKVFFYVTRFPITNVFMDIDDTGKPGFKQLENIPNLDKTKYETFLGGVSPTLRDKISFMGEAAYVGCIRDIELMDSAIDIQSLDISGAVTGPCDDLPPQPVLTGSLTGVILIDETDKVGSVIMNISADRPVRWVLVENPGQHFALDPESGELSVVKQLDRKDVGAPNDIKILSVRASQITDKLQSKCCSVILQFLLIHSCLS